MFRLILMTRHSPGNVVPSVVCGATLGRPAKLRPQFAAGSKTGRKGICVCVCARVSVCGFIPPHTPQPLSLAPSLLLSFSHGLSYRATSRDGAWLKTRVRINSVLIHLSNLAKM